MTDYDDDLAAMLEPPVPGDDALTDYNRVSDLLADGGAFDDLDLDAAELVAEHTGRVDLLDCAFERSTGSAVACEQRVVGFRRASGVDVPACAAHVAAGGILHARAARRLVAAANRDAARSLALPIALLEQLRASDYEAAVVIVDARPFVFFGERDAGPLPYRIDADHDGAVVFDRDGSLLGACSGGLREIVALAVEIALEAE